MGILDDVQKKKESEQSNRIYIYIILSQSYSDLMPRIDGRDTQSISVEMYLCVFVSISREIIKVVWNGKES